MIWDKLSPFYDFFETAYNGKCYKGIAEKIKEYVTEDDVVLECACGTGLLTLPMAQTCKKLIATDYSVGMLRQTKKKVKNYSNTKVGKASILELPFKKGAFGVKFKRQFSLDSYKEFLASHHISQVEYSVVDGRMPCAFAIITNC